MCFGGGSNQSAPPAPPPPAPIPTPAAPTDVTSQTADQRASVNKQLQYGILSTIKTSSAGISGGGPDLVSAAAGGQSGKKTLGGS